MSSNKTIIPGMEDAYTEQPNFGNQKPVIGFLYSISKSGSGEYWPLRIGSNTIGRADNCNVSLSEATVSEQHAVLVVQQMKNPEKVIAWINDSGSTCGTMINGESLGFDRRECFNGDIITIGEHYDLYFILIDAKQIGLNVCRDFISTQPAVRMGNRPQNFGNPYAAPTNNQFTQGYEQENVNPQGGTIGLDETENKPTTKPGGTIFM